MSWMLVGFQKPLRGQNNFVRGDVNCDGCVSPADGYDLARNLFQQVPLPCQCEAAKDADSSGSIELSDSIYLLNFTYLGAGPPPGAPYPLCGPAPAGTTLPCTGYPACPLFKRGDANQDGCVNNQDATFISNFLFGIGPAPACMQAADADDDDMIAIADSTLILAYCNASGPPPPAPGPLVCGDDPTPGALTCASYIPGACCGGCRNQLPCDATQDAKLDISDVVHLLGALFTGSPPTLPCGDGAPAHPSNAILMDCDGSLALDVSDAICILNYLFLGGAPPVRGTNCIYIEKCPLNPRCAPCL